MAVVEKYGSGYRDPAAVVNIDNIYAAGRVRAVQSAISIANGDSSTSKFWIANLPTRAILSPYGRYSFSAVTGVTSMHVGFYYPNGGALIDADALIAADDISSAGVQDLITHGTLTLANANKRVWELATLTADPGGELALVATINANATAAGTVLFVLPYSVA